MLDGLLAPAAAWIVGVIAAAGDMGVAGLRALEFACVPLPSEVIMPFAGYLASTGRFGLALAATAGAVGCNFGSTLAYAVGARGGRPMIERWGRYVLLNPGDLDRAERFFRRFGGPAVLIGRLLPVVRTFIALPAGIAHMPQLPFQLYTYLRVLIVLLPGTSGMPWPRFTLFNATGGAVWGGGVRRRGLPARNAGARTPGAAGHRGVGPGRLGCRGRGSPGAARGRAAAGRGRRRPTVVAAGDVAGFGRQGCAVLAGRRTGVPPFSQHKAMP